MSRPKKVPPQQIFDGVWYAVNHGGEPPFFEECCDCGLTHQQEWKIDNGRIYFRYAVDQKATAAARKRRGIVKP